MQRKPYFHAQIRIPLKTCLLIAFFLVAFSSCTKDNGPVRAYSFSFNGAQVIANQYTAIYHHDTTDSLWAFTGVFNISDTANYAYLQLSFVSRNIIQPGSYNYGQTYANETRASFSCVNGSKAYSETSGTLSVSSIDSVNHKISGAFQFTAVNNADAQNTISISNGTFTNLSYTVQ
jgi:hypothetical protein